MVEHSTVRVFEPFDNVLKIPQHLHLKLEEVELVKLRVEVFEEDR
jgi:predicted DNA-binding protein (UPF0251 family)